MTVAPSAPALSGDIHDPTSAAYKKARRKHWKSTRNRPENRADTEWTPFRAAEKNVLDVAAADPSRLEETARGGWRGRADAVECTQISLRGGRTGFMFPGTPGLVLLPAFAAPVDQRSLIRWALCEQAQDPNETNLDTHYVLPKSGLWNTYIRVLRGECDDEEVVPRASVVVQDESATVPPPPGPRQLISNEPASTDNLVALAGTSKPRASPSQALRPVPISSLVPKLRWANIGWFYHWGTKQYDFTKGPGEIAASVRGVCRSAVDAVPWDEVFSGQNAGPLADWGSHEPDWVNWRETYEPDAGIVNFYQTNDTLMAHVDRSELCATSPLVSVSLGCAAIFLIGGHTRDEAPTPILLRSGDVVIMSGPACRRAFHGVPRVLEETLPPHLESTSASDDWDPYASHLRTTRVNVNVRQVFPKGFDPVSEMDPRK
ncbi:uncharacterized protein BXZ73DRAFT_91352 [Epithele typhae]|uniref:uncharacterized protein n=1 Tax=Epithele typhae TaxID=378194 RepID=UPI002007E8DB|nr:uncharacterized protein BXZ73DRAFT_91352 [Epithele typhae]KAH9923938.1 hypothetical protein BXZ73DRAFT_91352 [Epithele typhae]